MLGRIPLIIARSRGYIGVYQRMMMNEVREYSQAGYGVHLVKLCIRMDSCTLYRLAKPCVIITRLTLRILLCMEDPGVEAERRAAEPPRHIGSSHGLYLEV